MKVKLITHTSNAEQIVAIGAKICYSNANIDTILSTLEDPKEVNKLVKKIVNMGHFSVLEHISYLFAVEGISRACSHQLVRHRIASYSQKSQRYTAEKKGLPVVVPDSIKNNKEQFNEFSFLTEQIYRVYTNMLNASIPKEDARYIFPNACQTTILITMNARELLQTFFRVRCCKRAQWEIRELAYLMLDKVKKISPLIFEKAGPSCILNGYCPEGEYSCKNKS